MECLAAWPMGDDGRVDFKRPVQCHEDCFNLADAITRTRPIAVSFGGSALQHTGSSRDLVIAFWLMVTIVRWLMR